MPITLAAGETRQLNISLTPVYVPPQPARLWGYVKDANTGYPIAGARVELIGLAYGLTDANGMYDISNIPAGTYSGKVSAAGYEDYTF